MAITCRCKKLIVQKMMWVLLVMAAGNFTTKAQLRFAVSPDKMNVFYTGVENPVSVAVSGSMDSKVTVTISGGGATITKAGPGHYIVTATTVTDSCIISVYTNGKITGTSLFRVLPFPVIYAAIGGHISGDSMPAEEFRKQSGVGLSVKDFPFNMKFEITGFSFSFDDAGGTIREFNCQGSVFSAAAKNSIIAFIQPGQTVVIDNIRVKGPDGQERKIPALVYYLK